MTETTDETDGQIGTGRLDELAEEHGLDADQVRELASTTEAECWECGRTADDVEPIETYPVGDGDTAKLCHDCYAEYLDDVTTLSTVQSTVWALHLAGMEASDIDRKLGKHPGQSRTAIRRSRDKAIDAKDEMERLRATIELVEGADDA